MSAITAMSLSDIAMEAPRSEPSSTQSGSRHIRGSKPLKCLIGVGARLGWIVSDADRQLMEVIYKDPVGERFSYGHQFCEEVGGLIVLLRDMM